MTAQPMSLARALHALFSFALLVMCASAFAQTNSIEAVNISPQAGGRVIVRVTLKEPPANPPAGFSCQQPAADRARFSEYLRYPAARDAGHV